MSPQRDVEAFIHLTDEAVRAVSGPHSRHAVLIEQATDTKIETPGGGVRVRGATPDRERATQVIQRIAARAATGAGVELNDVRAAISAVRAGETLGASPEVKSLPVGRKGVIAPKTLAQGRYLDALAEHELVFGVGPAGTGKTFLAVAYGASLLMRGEVGRLVVTRPAVEAGERLGFLPGDLSEKVDPYMAPVWEAMNDILGADALRRRRDRGEIEVAPIAFMRGRTLPTPSSSSMKRRTPRAYR